MNLISNQLVELEDSPNQIDRINQLFRAVHTVKGGSRLLKINKMEILCHKMENIMDMLRNNSLKLNSKIVDTLLDGTKLLQEMIEEVASRGPIHTRINPILRQLESIENQDSSTINKPTEKNLVVKKKTEIQKKEETPIALKETANQDTKKVGGSVIKEKNKEFIKVSTDKLDTVTNLASELSISKIQLNEIMNYINRIYREYKKIQIRAEENDMNIFIQRLNIFNDLILSDMTELFNSMGIEIPLSKIENIVRRFQNELVGELGRTELTITEEMTLLLFSIRDMRNSFLKGTENIEYLTSKLQSGIMSFRMVPIHSLFERFPVLVRDIARQCEKKVKVNFSGGEIEIDKVLIGRLIDPIMHILRNSLDHGIELPDDRVRSGKNDTGTISLSAFYQGSYAIIEIIDDGKGIDSKIILEKALASGLISNEKANILSEEEIIQYIFEPGLSTAKEVTELSGRGVGMDVVRNAIKNIQGDITIKSEIGVGTTIQLKIPLTLAVVSVLLFETGNHYLALPMVNILEIATITKQDLTPIGNQMFYHLRSEVIPVIYLGTVLGMVNSVFLPDEFSLIIITDGSKKLGLLIETLHGRQEIVIKNLGSLIKKAPFIMGCTILGNHKLVLVLNPREILDINVELEESATKLETQTKRQKSILIVDDSEIQRKSIKLLLNREGYLVDEAENGFDALKLVRYKQYSLLCVDVVMPLMDGFELVKRLRNLPLYRNIPIFLVTSKNSREDKDRGLKLGANEYFEKPVKTDIFLETINRYTRGDNIERENTK